MKHVAAQEVSNFSHTRMQRLGAAALALCVLAVYSVYSYFQYRHFLTPSWDLGIFAQLEKAYSQGNLPPIVPIKGEGFNLWGDHFHPILIVLAPIYWLFPTPATLLYVQAVLIAISAYVVMRCAQTVLPATRWGWLNPALLALAYSLSFGVQQAVSVQFHEVAFAAPLLALSLGYLVRARHSANSAKYLKQAVLWSLPLAFVKEDLGVTGAVISLVALWQTGWLAQMGRDVFPLKAQVSPWKRRLSDAMEHLLRTPGALESLLSAMWGIGWSILAVTAILPFFNTAGEFAYADKIDTAALLGDPLTAGLSLLYPGVKAMSLLMLLLVGLGIWVRSPLAWVALPTVLWRFLSPNEGYWESTWHYSLVLMPIVFLALINVLAPRLKPDSARDARRHPSQQRQVPLALLCSAAVLAVSLVMLPKQPLWQLTQSTFATLTLTSSDENKVRALSTIEPGARVASDLTLLTYLVPDHTVYWIGEDLKDAPDYVVIDIAGNSWGANPPRNPEQFAQQHFGAVYQLNHKEGSIYVLKKSA